MSLTNGDSLVDIKRHGVNMPNHRLRLIELAFLAMHGNESLDDVGWDFTQSTGEDKGLKDVEENPLDTDLGKVLVRVIEEEIGIADIETRFNTGFGKAFKQICQVYTSSVGTVMGVVRHPVRRECPLQGGFHQLLNSLSHHLFAQCNFRRKVDCVTSGGTIVVGKRNTDGREEVATVNL